MAEAKCRADWARTSSLMALAVNMMRDPRRGQPASPADFNPFAKHRPQEKLRGKDLEILRDVFCREKHTCKEPVRTLQRHCQGDGNTLFREP